MARENHINIPAHYNIYTGENTNRNLDIYFTEPELGVNSETGLLLLIPGFRGNPQSKVYKKMRLDFADRFNLVVIMCDYFGSEFMQKSNKIKLSIDINDYQTILSEEDLNNLRHYSGDFTSIINILSKYTCVVHATEILDENEDLFNDMGFMQAMDLLTALYAVKLILADNQLNYNNSKIIAYGYSHGAYLAYLCNRLAPADFSLIIDNSGWLSPVYMESPRYLNQYFGKMKLRTKFDYFARDLKYDKEILDLKNLYKNFKNNSQVWCFQGVNDHLVNYKEKENFCISTANTNFYIIDDKEIDNNIFYSTKHGLDANFLKLFYYVMRNVNDKNFSGKINSVKQATILKHSGIRYVVNFEKGLPTMSIEEAI